MNPREMMIEKTRVMLSMQDKMNSHVDVDWRVRERKWYRALWIECAELMDHYGGWKWWQHSTPDYDQVMLEIVDIWHFGLSMRIGSERQYRAVAEAIITEWEAGEAGVGFREEVERLAWAALGEKRLAVTSVRNLLTAIGRDFDDLYRAYVGKNVLNVFRQDHGYKTSEYVKDWNGREDNLVLVELVANLDAESAGFRDAIYRELSARYEQVMQATPAGD